MTDDVPYNVLLSMEDRITKLEQAVIQLQGFIQLLAKSAKEFKNGTKLKYIGETGRRFILEIKVGDGDTIGYAALIKADPDDVQLLEVKE